MYAVYHEASESVEVLANVDDRIVGVRYRTQYGLSFHPELERVEDAEWIYSLVFAENQLVLTHEKWYSEAVKTGIIIENIKNYTGGGIQTV